MSAPVRFLAVAVFGWVTMRAAGQVLVPEPLPPIPVPTPETPLLEAARVAPFIAPGPTYETASAQPLMAGQYPDPAYRPAAASIASGPAYMPRPYPMPVYYPVVTPPPAYPAMAARGGQSSPGWMTEDPGEGPSFRDMPVEGEAPEPKLALLEGGNLSRPKLLPSFVLPGQPLRPKLDRLSLSAWALVRQPTAVVIDPRAPASVPVSLASGGQLGGSQAGARLTYRFNRAFAANVRASSTLR